MKKVLKILLCVSFILMIGCNDGGGGDGGDEKIIPPYTQISTGVLYNSVNIDPLDTHFYKFTSESNGNYTISLTDLVSDMSWVLYTNRDINNPGVIDWQDDFLANNDEIGTTPSLSEGDTYYLAVDEWDDVFSSYDLQILYIGCITRPGDCITWPEIMFYQFSGNDATAIDSSGSNLNANIVGCNRVQGKVGEGLEILPEGYVWYEYPHGTDDGFNDSFEETDEISIETWIQLTTVEPLAIYHIFGGENEGVKFQINDEKLEFLYYNAGWKTIITGNSPLAANTWYYVAVTYNGRKARIYINGVENASRSIERNFPDWEHWHIGNKNVEGSSSNTFQGIIDELRVSNVKLTATEISDYYNDTK